MEKYKHIYSGPSMEDAVDAVLVSLKADGLLPSESNFIGSSQLQNASNSRSHKKVSKDSPPQV